MKENQASNSNTESSFAQMPDPSREDMCCRHNIPFSVYCINHKTWLCAVDVLMSKRQHEKCELVDFDEYIENKKTALKDKLKDTTSARILQENEIKRCARDRTLVETSKKEALANIQTFYKEQRALIDESEKKQIEETEAYASEIMKEMTHQEQLAHEQLDVINLNEGVLNSLASEPSRVKFLEQISACAAQDIQTESDQQSVSSSIFIASPAPIVHRIPDPKIILATRYPETVTRSLHAKLVECRPSIKKVSSSVPHIAPEASSSGPTIQNNNNHCNEDDGELVDVNQSIFLQAAPKNP